MNHRWSLWVYAAAALMVSSLPVVHWPLEWLATVAHETSHALVARLTGGRVDRIVLHLNGSGETWSAGGWRRCVSFAGYAGAIGWGALLYAAGAGTGVAAARRVLQALLALVLVAAVLWSSWDPISVLIELIVMGALLAAQSAAAASWARGAVRFLGMYVLTSALRAPLDLLGWHGDNDAQALAASTGVPGVVWVAVWMALGVGTCWGLWRWACRQDIPVSVEARG